MRKIIITLLGLLMTITAFSQVKDTIRLSEVIITPNKYNAFERVGVYNQPAWTIIRKFPSTRVYVMTPPGEVIYEKWFDIREPRNGKASEVRMRDEFAFGLGNRLELDLYSHTVYYGKNGGSTFGWRGFSGEVRYALADWGKLFGNPTLYFEYKFLNNERQGIEPKILFGDRIGKRGVWGLNLILEADVAKKRIDQSREWSYCASYGNIINDNFTLGVSHKYIYNDVPKVNEWYAGPFVQYTFNRKAYINVEYMPGLNKDAKKSRTLMIFTWKF
jgi:hypothetical protein